MWREFSNFASMICRTCSNAVHAINGQANKGFSMVGYTQMDLGIAKYHFEMGAGRDHFNWV